MINIIKNTDMSGLLYILSFVVLTTSCNNGKNQEMINDSITTKKLISTDSSYSLKENTSFEITYWSGYEARLHRLDYSNGILILYCDEDDFKSEIENKNHVKQLAYLIERFYINKTDDIILSSKKSAMITATDFSSIEIKVKDNGKLIVDIKTQIGSEKHEIEFHPDFIQLYELVQQLTKPCEKR